MTGHARDWDVEDALRLMRQVGTLMPDWVEGTRDWLRGQFPGHEDPWYRDRTADCIADTLLREGVVERCPCCGGFRMKGAAEHLQ